MDGRLPNSGVFTAGPGISLASHSVCGRLQDRATENGGLRSDVGTDETIRMRKSHVPTCAPRQRSIR
jgi:hypothetical protein